MRRLIWAVSSWSTLSDIQSFFTYKLLFKRQFVKNEKQTTNVVWNLAPKELNALIIDMSRGPAFPSKLHVRPAKTPISLGIQKFSANFCIVRQRKLGCLVTHWTQSNDSGQPAPNHCLADMQSCKKCCSLAHMVFCYDPTLTIMPVSI